MTKTVEKVVAQLQDVVSRENEDTLANIRQQIIERSQHVDFLEQWFAHIEQKIERDRRAAVEEVTATLTRGFRQLSVEVNKMKNAVLPGAIKAVEDLTESMNRFKE